MTARIFWKDAARLNDEIVSTYLTVARAACLAFAPIALTEDDAVPEHYRLAQVMHARNVYNAVNGDTQPVDPETGYGQIVSTPLDWHVRQLLRPVTAWGGIA
ncbi:hypothetical protein [Microbacterium sp. BH-3-3-3]|uniref:hypothetical protein n=1 Tax=Microbacterium sp. BH-3-3-3 TaxID=1906742 RepID=UPI0012E9FD12|nr:hypothetical protein [Microbacterium sp. BH-3-3-3]